MKSMKALIKKNLRGILESPEEKEERFHNAANNNNIEELEALLDSGNVDVNSQGNVASWTALHKAASNGHLDAVKMLLAYKANIDSLDKFGSTPLFYAIKNRQTDTVQFLLDRNASTRLKNKWGETALDSCDREFRKLIVVEDDAVESFTPVDSPRQHKK